jgi:hypothetical protein
MFFVCVLSVSLLGCNLTNKEYPTKEAIQYLLDNVEDADSLIIESVEWVEDDFDTIIYVISYDTKNESDEYLGYKTCFITYYEHPEEHPLRPGNKLNITFNDNDSYEVTDARYHKALQDNNDQGELTNQEIDEMLIEIRSSES